MKNKILRSMQEKKMLKSEDRVGLREKYTGKISKYLLKKKIKKKKPTTLKTVCNCDNQVVKLIWSKICDDLFYYKTELSRISVWSAAKHRQYKKF